MANEDKAYCAFLREMPCVMAGHGQCSDVTHVHHSTGHKGIGTKNHDHAGMPLCAFHHSQRHSLAGPFKGWTKPTIRTWEADTAAHYRELYLGMGQQDDF